MRRRQFMTGAAALALVGCSQSGSTTTIADVIAEIRKTCQFATEWEPIARIITTLISGFDPSAGAATTIAAAVAKQVVDLVCNAVKAQRAQMEADKKTVSGTMTVLVNGVEVPGTYGG